MSTNFQHFINCFSPLIATRKDALISACKRKYPDLNGRGAIFVFVPIEGFSDVWMSGFLADPVYHLINKSRIRTIRGISEETMELIEKHVDSYNPDEKLLFCFTVTETSELSSITIATLG